jgi:glucosamine-6-phosphate deaminase
MEKFEGILTHQTLSDEDFIKLMEMPVEQLEKWSNVGLRIVDNAQILYQQMARSIADVIIKNNNEGRDTKIILPVGPTPQYDILKQIINSERINLKNFWAFFMDEYLDWECRLVPQTDPMSFKGYMNRKLFDLIDKSLGLKKEQIIFPDPEDLNFCDEKIQELGGIDVCYGGLGYHGHIAFNEPYDTYYRRMTIEKYLASKTRIIDLNSDTFVINSVCGTGGNCYGLPPKAVTLGMKPIFEARRIEIYCDGGDLNWQLASLRLALMHPPTLDRPGTLLQLHPNPKEEVLFVADRLTAQPIIIAPK